MSSIRTGFLCYLSTSCYVVSLVPELVCCWIRLYVRRTWLEEAAGGPRLRRRRFQEAATAGAGARREGWRGGIKWGGLVRAGAVTRMADTPYGGYGGGDGGGVGATHMLQAGRHRLKASRLLGRRGRVGGSQSPLLRADPDGPLG